MSEAKEVGGEKEGMMAEGEGKEQRETIEGVSIRNDNAMGG